MRLPPMAFHATELHRSTMAQEMARIGFTWKPSAKDIVLACGLKHCVLQLEGGGVHTMGLNGHGQLGLGHVQCQERPQLVHVTLDVVAAACGMHHTVLLLQDGSIRSFGRNDYGQLGLGGTSDIWRPHPVPLSCAVTAVACGAHHTVLLMGDGTVCAFGCNAFGQLGFGHNAISDSEVPKPIFGARHIVSIACGSDHVLLLQKNGAVLSLGHNAYGQLGLSDRTDRFSITNTPNLGSNIAQIACGAFHSVARLHDGSVRACGVLGPDTENHPLVLCGMEAGVTEIACGAHSTLALLDNGSTVTSSPRSANQSLFSMLWAQITG